MFSSFPVFRLGLVDVANYCIVLGLTILLCFTSSIWSNYGDSLRIGQITFLSWGIIAVGGLMVLSKISVKNIVSSINVLDAFLLTMLFYVVLGRYLLGDSSGFSPRLIEYFLLCSLYLLLRCKIDFHQYFLFACVVGCLVQVAFGFLQLYGFYPSNNENFRITGSFFNPGPLSGYVLYGLCILIGVYFYKDQIYFSSPLERRVLPRISLDVLFTRILIIAIVCCIFLILVLKSRASWLGLILSIGFLAYGKYNYLLKKTDPKSKFYLLISIGIILVGTVFALYFVNKGSSDGRLGVWSISSEIFRESSVLGIGFDNFNSRYMDQQAKFFASNPQSEFRHIAGDIKYPFNILLLYLLENGIIGALILGAILMRVILINTKEPISMILKTALLGQLIFAFFSYSEQILPIKINIVCSMAFLASKDHQVFSLKISNFWLTIFKYSVVSTYIACSIFYANYLYRLNQSYRNWNVGLQIYSSKQYLDAIPFFGSAYPFLKRDGEFLMQYGNCLLKANRQKAALALFNRAEIYFNNYPLQISKGECYKILKIPDMAIDSYRMASNMVPSRLYPRYLLAMYLLHLGKKESSIEIAKFILKMPIKVKSPASDSIQYKMTTFIDNQYLDSQHILSLIEGVP